MNHKRKRHKAARAGCMLCKPHKRNGACASKLVGWQGLKLRALVALQKAEQ